MSLARTGVWAIGVWNTGVWAQDVWYESGTDASTASTGKGQNRRKVIGARFGMR